MQINIHDIRYNRKYIIVGNAILQKGFLTVSFVKRNCSNSLQKRGFENSQKLDLLENMSWEINHKQGTVT